MAPTFFSRQRRDGDERHSSAIGVLGALRPELLGALEEEGEVSAMNPEAGKRYDAVVLGPASTPPPDLSSVGSPAVIRLVSNALSAPRTNTHHEVWLPDCATPAELSMAVHDALEIRRLERELHETRETLARTQARYEAAMHASRTGIWRRDVATDTVEWSDELHEIFGLEPGTFPGTHEAFLDLVHPDDRPYVVATFEHALMNHREYEVEFRFRHGSGEYRWIEGRGCGCFHTDGTLVEMIGVGIDITERKRAQAQVLDHESTLREIGDNLPDGALYQVMLCPSGKRCFLYVGASFERLTGVPVAEVLRDAQSLYSLIYPPDVPLMEAAEERCKKEMSHFEIEVRLRHRQTGEWRWVHLQSTPHELPDGACVWSGIYMDITEHRRVDEVLAQTLDRLDLAQRAGRVGVFDWDVSSGEVIWSEEEYLLFGVSRAEFEGTIADWAKRVNRDDVRRLRREVRDAIKRHLPEMNFSFRITHGVTGSVRWIEGGGRFTYDESGNVMRAVGVNQDVTDRMEAQEQLAELNRQLARRVAELEAVADVLPVGITIAHDPNCEVVTANPALARMLRIERPKPAFTSEDADSMGHAFYHQGNLVQRQDMPLWVAARTGTAVPAKEFEARLRDGSMLHLLLNAAPLLGEDGSPRGAVAAVVDISEAKRAQRVLQEIDRRKNEFLAMLSHELRNPLAAIRNALQVLESTGSDVDDTHWAREVIHRQSEQLALLVDDLLDVARITRGRIELRKETVDVGSVLDEAAESVRGLVRERNHELVCTYPHHGALLIEADRSRLEQIVVNLLTNAAKYTRNGGRISLVASSSGTGVTISVSDTGIGIPAEKLPEMFELFTQGERSIDRSDGGLGLGLTIVRQLAELHGGRATAFSEGPGKGSVFTVHLPVGNIAQPVAAHAAAPSPVAPKAAGRVLVIDDNMDTAHGLGKLLSRRGYIVQVAYEGFSGMQLARSFNPDIMLVDLGLPGMTGYELAEKIRADEDLSGVFLVAVSGYGQEEDCARTRQVGFDHHLVKPVAFEILEKLLRERMGPVAG